MSEATPPRDPAAAFELLRLELEAIKKLLVSKQQDDVLSQYIPLEKLEERYGLSIRFMRDKHKRREVVLNEISPKKFFISAKELIRFMESHKVGHTVMEFR